MIDGSRPDPPCTLESMFSGQKILDPKKQGFDVICAGDAIVNAEGRPGGGALDAALALAGLGMRVGLATVVSDDTRGRALVARVAASGVDVGGVERAQPRSDLLFVRGGARQVVSAHEVEQPVAVPEPWFAPVLLLSGMSPVLSHGAALCKAARAARRAGSLVVVDVNADWHLWKGRDARAIRMVLREADVVSCSAQDLFGLNMDVPTLRAALRPTAVLVLSDGAGRASASGPFGEVAHAIDAREVVAGLGGSDAFSAAIASELARAGHTDEGTALWARVLQKAHAALLARARR